MRKTKVKTKLKSNQNGITLIALVITIIVLLILAGVAISMLSGENGILRQAAKAKTETDVAKLSESIKLAATTAITDVEHKLTEEEFKIELEEDGYTIDEDGTVTENNIKYAVTSNGAVKATIGELKKEESIVFADTKLVDVNNEKIVVPVGFKIKSDSPTLIKDGVVVVAPDGSEFVWVPVPNNPVISEGNETLNGKYGLSGMYGQNSSKVQLGKTYAFKEDGTVKAYGWSLSNGYMKYPTDTNIPAREPSIAKNTTYGDSSEQSLKLLNDIVGIKGTIGTDDSKMLSTWETQLQDEFDEMIKYVKINEGFYVGRYETSIITKNNGKTKIAQTVGNKKSATTEADSANTWYGLYQLQKEYSMRNNIEDSVGSGMIWGCQWDQMMMWMKNYGYNVTSNEPKEGVSMNMNEDITGIEGDIDIMNNIYDIIGCNNEYTMEWIMNGKCRTFRGTSKDFGSSLCPAERGAWQPIHGTWDFISSRMTLYVK